MLMKKYITTFTLFISLYSFSSDKKCSLTLVALGDESSFALYHIPKKLTPQDMSVCTAQYQLQPDSFVNLSQLNLNGLHTCSEMMALFAQHKKIMTEAQKSTLEICDKRFSNKCVKSEHCNIKSAMNELKSSPAYQTHCLKLKH